MEDLHEFCYVFQSPWVHEEHLIKQKFVGQNCWNFDLVSKILFDEILSDKVSFLHEFNVSEEQVTEPNFWKRILVNI